VPRDSYQSSSRGSSASSALAQPVRAKVRARLRFRPWVSHKVVDGPIRLFDRGMILPELHERIARRESYLFVRRCATKIKQSPRAPGLARSVPYPNRRAARSLSSASPPHYTLGCACVSVCAQGQTDASPPFTPHSRRSPLTPARIPLHSEQRLRFSEGARLPRLCAPVLRPHP